MIRCISLGMHFPDTYIHLCIREKNPLGMVMANSFFLGMNSEFDTS